MMETADYKEARDLLASLIHITGTEVISLESAQGRILACDLIAEENVPSFDRSPYDGYAFRALDSAEASAEHPVTLTILEEVPAGAVPSCTVKKGTAVKILTGAPIPEGADAVIMFEKTEFTADQVKLFGPAKPGENIIYAGEDIRKGALLAAAGTLIDAGLAGSLAAQGVYNPTVYRKPVIGIISTGSELMEKDSSVTGCASMAGVPAVECASEAGVAFSGSDTFSVNGKIRNTNRYSFAAALQKDGCITKYLGTAGDHVREIADLIEKGLKETDLVLLTGGVSVGDYDLTPQAMEAAGCELLINGVGLKPGMACCYGVRDGKLVCGLSGNPSSSLTNYYSVLRPAIRKMTGLTEWMPPMVRVTLAEDFRKKSKGVRILKGTLSLENGQAVMHIPKEQGNVVISSSIGCDVMAIVPEGRGPLEAGTQLEGFLI